MEAVILVPIGNRSNETQTVLEVLRVVVLYAEDLLRFLGEFANGGGDRITVRLSNAAAEIGDLLGLAVDAHTEIDMAIDDGVGNDPGSDDLVTTPIHVSYPVDILSRFSVSLGESIHPHY